MAARATGSVVVDTRRKRPVYGLRFRAHGRRQYVTLGTAEAGWMPKKAQGELDDVLAKVKLGIWKPPEPEPAPNVERDPFFHVFATDWFEAHEGEWRPKTRLDYEWKLSHHLLPFFKNHRLSQITIAEVDRYRATKVKQGRLSASSINKTIALLAQALEVAVEYPEYEIERNPARGRRRRLKADRAAPVWLDSAEHIAALLDAAGELDREARVDRQVPRRAILATLTLAGLRVAELVQLRWRDVDLAGGRITVCASKTDAGARAIDLLPALKAELERHKAAQSAGGQSPSNVLSLQEHRTRRRSATRTQPRSAGLVFPTGAGGPLNQSNVRNRVLAKAVERANERLEADGGVPLPAGLTPHKLRHTFASLLVALGTDPGAVMDQLGHEDASLTLRVYRHGMRRDQESRAALRDLVGGTAMGSNGASIGQRLGSSAFSEGEKVAIEGNGGGGKVAH